MNHPRPFVSFVYLICLMFLSVSCSLCFASEEAASFSPVQQKNIFSKIKLKIPNIEVYETQAGDTMSSIALQFFTGGSLYGAGGRLELLLKLNPHIKDGDTIFPGETLVITPKRVLAEKAPQRQVALVELAEQDLTEENQKLLVQLEVKNIGYSLVKFSVGGSFYRIDSLDTASDSSGSLLSTLSPNFKLSWEPHLNNHYFIKTEMETVLSQWENPIGRVVQNKQESLSAFSFAVGKKYSQGSRALIKVQQSEALVPRSLTTEQLRLEKSHFTLLGAGLEYSLLRQSPFQLDGILDFGISFGSRSGDLTIDQGSYYGVGFRFSQVFKKMTFSNEVLYSVQSYNTNFSKNEIAQLQFLFGLGFELSD